MRQMLSSDKMKKQSVEEDLIAEGNYVKQKTREIREQLIRAQTEARKQLSSLTVLSNKATKKLEATIAKVRVPHAPRVLHFALDLTCGPFAALPCRARGFCAWLRCTTNWRTNRGASPQRCSWQRSRGEAGLKLLDEHRSGARALIVALSGAKVSNVGKVSDQE